MVKKNGTLYIQHAVCIFNPLINVIFLPRYTATIYVTIFESVIFGVGICMKNICPVFEH